MQPINALRGLLVLFMDNFQSKKDNIFYKSAISLLKIIALIVLIYLFFGKIVFAENKTQLGIGLFVLIFITLPTIFIIFFKEKSFKKHPKLGKFWKIYRIFYVIFIVLYIALWIFGTWHINQIAKTQKAINFINSQKITLDDVMGKNLPPQPDQKINDSTIAGIDANKNNIRDDVELAIFKNYTYSAKIRAAELQYVLAVQLKLTKVFDRETYIEAQKKKESAYECLGYAISGDNYSKSSGQKDFLSVVGYRDVELSNLILNTSLREKIYSESMKYYTSFYSSPMDNYCDVDISLLPN